MITIFKTPTFLTKAAIALLGGISLALAYPPFGQSYLIFFSIIPLLFSLSLPVPPFSRKRQFFHGFGVGYSYGLGFFLMNFKWLLTVAWAGWLAMALYLALFPALFAGMSIFLLKGIRTTGNWSQRLLPNLKIMTLTSCIWVMTEWLRSWLLTGMGWNGLAVPLIETPLLAQSAEWIGVYGLSFLPLFINVALFITLLSVVQEAKHGKLRAHPEFSFAMALLVITFSHGLLRLNSLKKQDFTHLNTLAIQGNFSLQEYWNPHNNYKILNRYESVIQEAHQAYQQAFESALKKAVTTQTDSPLLQQFKPDLILFPEDSMPFKYYPNQTVEPKEILFGQDGNQWLAQQQHYGNLLVGISGMGVEQTPQGLFPSPETGLWNSALLTTPEPDQPLQIRSKKHLVPFGEYIPFRKQLPFLEWIFTQQAGFSMGGDILPGDSKTPMTLNKNNQELQITPLICFEDTVANIPSTYDLIAPQFLVNLTNDGWFLQSEAVEQHYQNAKFRAIEQRSPLIRAGNTGKTAIVNIFGMEESGLNALLGHPKEQINTGTHTPGSYSGIAKALTQPLNTPYRRWGDWFCILCLIISLLPLAKAIPTKDKKAV